MKTSLICLVAVILTAIVMLTYGEMSTRKYTQPLFDCDDYPVLVLDTVNIAEISFDCTFYVVEYNEYLYIVFSDDTHGDIYVNHELKQVAVYTEDLIVYKKAQ